MSRRRLTQVFPFLIPLRTRQRVLFFYLGMKLDKNRYAVKKLNNRLPHQVYQTQSLLLNEKSGFDMQYQINKVHNLKLASMAMNRVIIRPNETFSFWQLVKNAEKYGTYKDGLCLSNGKITTVTGGGLCQLSNLIFWLFLHTPLTIIERHSHGVESFPLPPSDIPGGTDATIHEGWLDLKLKNETDATFQIVIFFDEEYIHGAIFTDKDSKYRYEVSSRDNCYFRSNGKIYHKNSIFRTSIDYMTNEVINDLLLYQNQCEIAYQLPEDTPILEKGE